MFKKLFILAAALALTATVTVNVFAASISDIVSSSSVSETKQFLATITRPQGDETTFASSYAICGTPVDNDDNLKVALAVCSENSDHYTYLAANDGKSVWTVHAGDRLFTKEIDLPYAVNKLKIVVYKADADQLIPGKNCQVNYFTVTVLQGNIFDKIKNGVVNLFNIFN